MEFEVAVEATDNGDDNDDNDVLFLLDLVISKFCFELNVLILEANLSFDGGWCTTYRCHPELFHRICRPEMIH